MPADSLGHGGGGGVRGIGAGGVSLGATPVPGAVPEGAGAGMPFMPMAPGAGGAPKEEHRSDASGLVARGVEPWADAHGDVPGDGEVAPSGGASAGGPGLVHQSTGATVSPHAEVDGVTLPGATGVGMPAPKKKDEHDDAVPVPALFPLPGTLTGAAQPTPATPPVPPVSPATQEDGVDEPAAVRPGLLPTAARVGVAGASVPPEGETVAGAQEGAGEAGLGAAAASEEAAVPTGGGMMPPYGMPGGASKGGDERSDSSGLLGDTEKGWADPGTEDLPSETQGAPAGGAILRGAGSAASDELAEDRVARVRSAETVEDTSAWEASDPAMLWALGGRRSEDEEEEELLPKYVLSDDDGWSDQDGAAPEAGMGADEDEQQHQQDDEDTAARDPGWSDEDGAAFAAGLGFPQAPAPDSSSAEPVTAPALATWRPDRSQAAAAEQPPMPVTAYAGMLLSTADVPDDEEEDEQEEETEEGGDEAKSGHGIADLLRQGADSWGAVPDQADMLG
ncbi:hypothetical protein ACFY1U_12735 [Streptomyces sp. NPDC001351]|uniref:hypothetical protein n=1 Tax=Streptomyces sp. NPDC001351 TaxID=3364564 RepID=UPI003679D840